MVWPVYYIYDTLIGGKVRVVAMLERFDNGLPQAVIFKAEEDGEYS